VLESNSTESFTFEQLLEGGYRSFLGYDPLDWRTVCHLQLISRLANMITGTIVPGAKCSILDEVLIARSFGFEEDVVAVSVEFYAFDDVGGAFGEAADLFLVGGGGGLACVL